LKNRSEGFCRNRRVGRRRVASRQFIRGEARVRVDQIRVRWRIRAGCSKEGIGLLLHRLQALQGEIAVRGCLGDFLGEDGSDGFHSQNVRVVDRVRQGNQEFNRLQQRGVFRRALLRRNRVQQHAGFKHGLQFLQVHRGRGDRPVARQPRSAMRGEIYRTGGQNAAGGKCGEDAGQGLEGLALHHRLAELLGELIDPCLGQRRLHKGRIARAGVDPGDGAVGGR